MNGRSSRIIIQVFGNNFNFILILFFFFFVANTIPSNYLYIIQCTNNDDIIRQLYFVFNIFNTCKYYFMYYIRYLSEVQREKKK